MAAHEAGHAVGHWALGWPFATTGVRFNDAQTSGMGWTRVWVDPAVHDMDDYLVATAAGAVAEAVVTREDPRELWRRWARHDAVEAARVLKTRSQLPAGGPEAVVEYLAGWPSTRARELLAKHQRIWAVLGRELVRRDRVTWDEFLALPGVADAPFVAKASTGHRPPVR